jgi:putative membrane protein insertion efficiency factor
MKNYISKLLHNYHTRGGGTILAALTLPGMGCRFLPTCSEYTQMSIEKYGLVRGCGRAIVRLGRCNPLFHGGLDLP